MKCRSMRVLMLCVLLIWIVTPAWGEEGSAPAIQTPPTAQPAPEQPTTQPPAPPAVQTAATPAQAPPVAGKPVAPPASKEEVQIQDAVVCQDVVDRAPVGSADVFSKNIAKVYCFCRVIGVEGESFITHNWYYKGALKSSIKLPVRAASWRTYSAKTMNPEWTGEWMVEILSATGTPLGSIVFLVQ
ncbi:MAG: DUF2914 domain-containing protein [Desulfobacteraceae bacterium]|nr:DUF2914 domain-containing protein [Desulfobacteraceae bacterium]